MTATTGDDTTPRPDEARRAPVDVLTPIPGEPLDRPPRPKPVAVGRLEQRSRWMSVVWKATERFKAARAPLIAGGTAYYAFLAMFSLLAFAYGMVAIFGADALARWLTDALDEALPGVVGDGGIDPATLTQIGRSASVVGLVVMGWAGAAVMVAASDALHQIYGASPDGRNLVARRIHLLGWLCVLGPLIIVSYTLTTAATGFGGRLLDDWGIESTLARVLLIVGATLLTYGLDVAILALLLGRLGGIRASRRSILTGAVVGGVVIGVLKALMATIISWSVDKPEYGSFALPISILVVLWLQSMALYASASITAATAETGPGPGADRGDVLPAHGGVGDPGA
jgi:membrane protein